MSTKPILPIIHNTGCHRAPGTDKWVGYVEGTSDEHNDPVKFDAERFVVLAMQTRELRLAALTEMARQEQVRLDSAT